MHTGNYFGGGTPYRQFLSSAWRYAVHLRDSRNSLSQKYQFAMQQMRFPSSKCIKTRFAAGLCCGPN